MEVVVGSEVGDCKSKGRLSQVSRQADRQTGTGTRTHTHTHTCTSTHTDTCTSTHTHTHTHTHTPRHPDTHHTHKRVFVFEPVRLVDHNAVIVKEFKHPAVLREHLVRRQQHVHGGVRLLRPDTRVGEGGGSDRDQGRGYCNKVDQGKYAQARGCGNTATHTDTH